MRVRRPWALPLVPFFGAAVAVTDGMRAAGWLRQRRLEWPVLSVGSLSAGGAGKTPVTIALARLLRQRGWHVDILSRGYGRQGKGVDVVHFDEGEEAAAAQRFGDEPTLMARRAGVPVWVGARRFAAGQQAEREAGTDGRPGVRRLHLLDDGFQHRSLARQFDLVLVTAEDLKDVLLPAGNLREGFSALRRADAFAVREEELDEVAAGLRRMGRVEAPVWTLRRSLHFPAPLGVFGAGLRPLAFCGLARPENFAAMLTAAGCGLVDTVLFPDHHRYGKDDLQTLVRTAKHLQATGLMTTEKDAVKLTAAMRGFLEAEIGPLVVVPLQVQFVYESPVVRALTARWAQGRPAGAASAERVR